MTDQPDHPQPGSSKLCRGPGCGRVFHRPPGMKRNRWEATQTCSRSCGSRLGNSRVHGTQGLTRHRCALNGCYEWVPRISGEPDSRYATRRYCGDAHRRTAGNRNRAREEPVWKVERSCVCGARFVPNKRGQRFHDAACAAANRAGSAPGETPVWRVERECACGVRFVPRRREQKFHGPSCPMRPGRSEKPAPDPEPPMLVRVPVEREVWRPASLGGPKKVVEYVLVESTG